ncbi:hypothetical protein [[Mycoplasma] collis]|uniref:hypothetical protein n=1 Tax=[Mycoplasma] collis TaxID=2127 RepID=UPI00051ADADD|nr:hypothetical protein [[Mycoplasma] collis]
MFKSNNNYEKIVNNLKKTGFKKIDYHFINVDEFWMNFSLKENFNGKPKKFKTGKYFNSNVIQRLKKFNPDFMLNSEVYILKNEYFNFDSSKMQYFSLKEGTINDYFMHEVNIQKGPYQTLFFVQNNK